MTGQQEYRITEEEVGIIEIALKSDKHCKKCPYEGGGFNQGVKSFLRSRPVQASQDSILKEPGIHEDCNFWKIRACKNITTKNCWNTSCPDHDEYKEQQSPTPPDEQCRICEQAIRKDATGKVLDYLDEWINSGENLSLFKWEVREVLREFRSEQGEQQ